MGEHWPKITIVGLLAVVVGVPFVLRPDLTCPVGSSADTAEKLIIFTPHNEQIRFEFGAAFNAWRAEQGLPPVEFDWRAGGGTADLRRQIEDRFASELAKGRTDPSIGVDLFFGGGEYDHNKLANGKRVRRDGEEVLLSASVPARLPDQLLAEVFPEPTIGSERLYHPELKWIGVALSSFGIVYNRQVVAMLGLSEPVTWSDLTDGRYQGWIALADPGHSGSIAATYHAILRRQGWTEGWALLRRAFANARYFTASSSKVPVDVSAGEAAAGMCIDFYGRFQAGAIGGSRIGYVDPPFLTATTVDPVSVLRGGPHPALAHQFVAWLLSTDGQRLWQRRIGTPYGPRRFELRRQPVRRDLYADEERAYWADPGIDPFATARPFPEGMPFFFDLVAPIAHAMAIDVHDDLAEAWSAVWSTPEDHRYRSEMVQRFDAMPAMLTLTWPDAALAENWATALVWRDHPRHADVVKTLSDFKVNLHDRYSGPQNADRLLHDQLEWTLFFRRHYRRIVRLAADARPAVTIKR